ncbi:MAG: DNA polymerase III subunit epsilon [Rickettsiales bacterium]|jgi:DNA polymerase-3 subunit epsilon|nr:DNA polymerase III subunit epsilon [Rickettsiales bacterium]
MREVVLDTETTGLNYSGADRIVEIGCVELVNHTPTGRTFHVYVNPERPVPQEVRRIHGLTDEFLRDKPKFAEIADEFLKFVDGADIVAHNAEFDFGFVDMELARMGRGPLPHDRLVDTLAMSRAKNPQFASHSLDALCGRYGIDNSHRELHGALLDARLLTDVYIELLGGKEVDFFGSGEIAVDLRKEGAMSPRSFRAPRDFAPSASELAAHAEFVRTLGENAVWAKYDGAGPAAESSFQQP